MAHEEWKVVPSYPWFEASSQGRIRRRLIGLNGWKPGMIVRGSHARGYLVIHTKSGKFHKRGTGIHVMVCEAFYGPRPSPDHEVAHWDGNRTNNCFENLRWATPKENAADRFRHGTQLGHRNPAAKLLALDVIAIRHLKAFGFRGSDIALMFDMNRNAINRIAAGKAWTAVTIAGAANGVLSFGS